MGRSCVRHSVVLATNFYSICHCFKNRPSIPCRMDNITNVNQEARKLKVKAVRKGQKAEKQKPATKIIIRNLPPTMTEEEFLQHVDPISEHDNYIYCLADWSLGLEATCRAYLTMKNVDDVYLFRDRFDGYVFVDSRGTEYVAMVEYAPFQGLLKKKSRSYDSKENTIELDPLYQQYLEKLTAEREEATRMGDIKTDFMLERKVEDKITSTPLLQYLASKKEKRREEARKRNEEKRRQREEEKQRQAQQKSPKSGQNRPNDQNKQFISKKDGKNSQQMSEERKNSRSKRRAERDQRRREEHAEQRKKTRERANREQNSKSEVLEQKGYSNQKEESVTESKVISKSILENENVKKSTDIEKKLVKTEEASSSKTKPIGDLQDEDDNNAVKNFIFSVAGANEYNDMNSSNNWGTVSLQTNNGLENKKMHKLRSLEDRRIRNKDRPSIAIYQPKARLRTSEEKSEKQNTDDSLLNAECEILNKDDKKLKRDTGRRTDHRSKQICHEEEGEEPNYCKSRLSEDGNMASTSKSDS